MTSFQLPRRVAWVAALRAPVTPLASQTRLAHAVPRRPDTANHSTYPKTGNPPAVKTRSLKGKSLYVFRVLHKPLCLIILEMGVSKVFHIFASRNKPFCGQATRKDEHDFG